MAKLDVTHSDGDTFSAGVTTDTDKLNGIIERINEHTHDGSDTEKITSMQVSARTEDYGADSTDATALTVTVTGGTFDDFIGLHGQIDPAASAQFFAVDANPNGGGAVVVWVYRSGAANPDVPLRWSIVLDTDDTTKMDFVNDTVFRVRHNGTATDRQTEVWGI